MVSVIPTTTQIYGTMYAYMFLRTYDVVCGSHPLMS